LTIIDPIATITKNKGETSGMVYISMNKTNMNQQQQLIIKFDNGLFELRSE